MPQPAIRGEQVEKQKNTGNSAVKLQDLINL